MTLLTSAAPASVMRVGDPNARLLAGPPAAEGMETLDQHVERLGPLPSLADGDELLALVDESGLGGRGGGGFRVARKMDVARRGARRPLVIVNAAESEPASRKDETLCRLRPHLVLDGAAVAAAAVGAAQVVVYSHRSASATAAALQAAAVERAAQGLPDPSWALSRGPDRYVAGEASAAASFVAGGQAKPRFLPLPLAAEGVDGRPTVVHNVETVAHLGLLARRGARWWREAGTEEHPGSRLVTVAGAAPHAGAVVEVVDPAPIGAALAAAGVEGPPAGVLVGGYAGRWLAGDTAWMTPFSPDALRAVGAAPGCGLLAVLPHGVCGLAETARLTAYLAGESAGQCGPCVFGLAEVAETVDALAAGRARRRDVRRLRHQLDAVTGRGGCHHPDGVAAMVASAVEVFADDVSRHVRGRPCPRTARPPVLPVPPPCRDWR